jgi:hypothetical protein
MASESVADVLLAGLSFTDSGEIDTTKRHHFRPPRAAVFNRRQQPVLARRMTG